LPLTLQLKEVPLGAALQAIEDQNPPLKFVVRDYGILVTNEHLAAERGFVPAVQLWREGRHEPPHEDRDASPEERTE
jgi:hypothetical protein